MITPRFPRKTLPHRAVKFAALGLVTLSPDDIDWDDEIRIAIEERAAMSPDALTGLGNRHQFNDLFPLMLAAAMATGALLLRPSSRCSTRNSTSAIKACALTNPATISNSASPSSLSRAPDAGS